MAHRHRHFGAIDHVSVGNFSGKVGVVTMKAWRRLDAYRQQGHVSECQTAHPLSDRARQRSTAPIDPGSIRRKLAASEKPSSVVHLQADRTTPTPHQHEFLHPRSEYSGTGRSLTREDETGRTRRPRMVQTPAPQNKR